VIVALALLGCANKGDGDAARTEARNAGDGAGGGERVLRFWQFWDAALVEPLVREFEAANPGVRVEMETLTWASGFEKIVVAIASNKAPDLVELGSTWVPKFAAEGALRDLTGDVADLRGSLVQWESGMRGERAYAIPWLVGTRVLFANRDLLERAGAGAVAPATWDALLTASRRIHAPDRGVYGFGMNAGERHVLYKKFLPFVWSNGGDVLDAQGRPALSEARSVEALAYYKSLVPYSLLERQDQLDLAFEEGKLGFTISGGWLGKRLAEKGDAIRWAIAPLPKPRPDAPPSASFAGAEMLAIPASSQHAADALRLARFLVDGRRALVIAEREKSVLPAATDSTVAAYYDAHPDERVYLDVLKTAKAPPAHAAWVEMQEALNVAIEEVLFGRAEPSAALARADSVIARLVAPAQP
jgi:ABC-type glycerol-3-phosphate transport system substrate-binding protein